VCFHKHQNTTMPYSAVTNKQPRLGKVQGARCKVLR